MCWLKSYYKHPTKLHFYVTRSFVKDLKSWRNIFAGKLKSGAEIRCTK